MVSDGLMYYQKVDLFMGEFWLNSFMYDKFNDMLDVISGVYIYGKNIIQVEGFIEICGVWDEDFVMLKFLLDCNYVLGINKFFFYVYIYNFWMNCCFGMILDGIGFFFQCDQIWWEEGKFFVDYIICCQILL